MLSGSQDYNFSFPNFPKRLKGRWKVRKECQIVRKLCPHVSFILMYLVADPIPLLDTLFHNVPSSLALVTNTQNESDRLDNARS